MTNGDYVSKLLHISFFINEKSDECLLYEGNALLGVSESHSVRHTGNYSVHMDRKRHWWRCQHIEALLEVRTGQVKLVNSLQIALQAYRSLIGYHLPRIRWDQITELSEQRKNRTVGFYNKSFTSDTMVSFTMSNRAKCETMHFSITICRYQLTIRRQRYFRLALLLYCWCAD